MVGVGIVGDYEDLRPLVQHYEPHAADIFFPFPAKLADGPRQGVGQLLSSSPLKECGERPARRKVPMNAMTREQETIYETHCTQDKLAGKGSSLPRRL